MIPLLVEAAAAMDTVYQQQIYPAKDSLLLRSPTVHPPLRGAQLRAWDRLDGDRPFVSGVGPRPPGADLYPHDLTKEELERGVAGSADSGRALRSLYTVVRRDCPGRLVAVPTTRRTPGPSGTRPPGCARRRRWPATPASGATSSCARRRWRRTITSRATSPGST